jgi:GntR family transcriptional repressor for pyruvate dehydrogenase complex
VRSQVTGTRTSATRYVLDDLRASVLSGAMAVGDRLPSEAALAARYSVSRAVIREVLRASEALGLTLTRTGKGTFVVANHPADLLFEGYSAAHLMEARPGVEVPAAGFAALRRSPEQLAELERLNNQMATETDDATWARLDAAFHLSIAEASGNPVFRDVVARIATALRQQSGMLNDQVGRRRSSQAEHRAITSAIGRASVVEAEDAMTYHLEAVREALATKLTNPDHSEHPPDHGSTAGQTSLT